LLATLFLARRLVNDRSFSFPLLFLRFADQARLTDMFQRAQLWELHIEIYWAIRPHLTAYPRPDMPVAFGPRTQRRSSTSALSKEFI